MKFTEIKTKFFDSVDKLAQEYNQRVDNMFYGPMGIEERLNYETARNNYLLCAIAATLSELARKEENAT